MAATAIAAPAPEEVRGVRSKSQKQMLALRVPLCQTQAETAATSTAATTAARRLLEAAFL